MERSKNNQQDILQRIDALVEELQLLRREVADLMVRDAAAANDEAEALTTTIIDDIAQEECYKSTEDIDPKTEAEPKKEPEPELKDLFVPLNSEVVLESTFEEKVSFDLVNHLSLADKFLYANELFAGNQSELMVMLEEIERLSSWSHVESYLYSVQRFDRENEAVKHLVEFIKEHSK